MELLVCINYHIYIQSYSYVLCIEHICRFVLPVPPSTTRVNDTATCCYVYPNWFVCVSSVRSCYCAVTSTCLRIVCSTSSSRAIRPNAFTPYPRPDPSVHWYTNVCVCDIHVCTRARETCVYMNVDTYFCKFSWWNFLLNTNYN